MTDIPRLIEKLEAATEGSITLDVEVLNACGYGSSDQFPYNRHGFWSAPTRSVDDALTLCEVMVPSWTRSVDATLPEAGITVILYDNGRKPLHPSDDVWAQADHALEPIATTMALLIAMNIQSRAREGA